MAKIKKKYQLIAQRMTDVGQICPDILIPFANDYTIKLTASDISKKTKIPRRTVSRKLAKLVKLNLARYSIEGKNKKFYLDLKDQKVKVLINFIENYKALKFINEQKEIYIILEEIIKLRDVVLFGSYAKGQANNESDVDILIIGNQSEKIREIARTQIKKIGIQFSTLVDFEKLLKKKNTLAIEIIKNHIIFGSSQFFNLCWRFYNNEL
jgi:predicted nucleotidyltransferase